MMDIDPFLNDNKRLINEFVTDFKTISSFIEIKN